MYRYVIDNAITYTSEDLVLFKESPFACWMERLTLENPAHGIAPDFESKVPTDSMEPQGDLVDTLCAEGKDVVQVDLEIEEPLRRTATLEAMRHGVDFIINGQLSMRPLAGSANLLMRTSGYSELGNYLYVPCTTQPKATMHSALRLCFLADLLDSLQGQLPPQMLIIRGGADVVPLQTEDHIYHYRAVKKRFMATQLAFHKHAMPDPSESSHFGRWGDCANEVMKQRALHQEKVSAVSGVAGDLGDAGDGSFDGVGPSTASSQPQSGFDTAYDLDRSKSRSLAMGPAAANSGGTLIEQARLLSPGDMAPPVSAGPDGDTLQNLAFIGSNLEAVPVGRGNPREPRRHPVRPSIRESTPMPMPSRMAPPPKLHHRVVDESSANAKRGVLEGHLSSRASSQRGSSSLIDLDIADASGDRLDTTSPSLSSLPEVTGESGPPVRPLDPPETKEHFADTDNPSGRSPVDPFDNCLMTSDTPGTEDSLS